MPLYRQNAIAVDTPTRKGKYGDLEKICTQIRRSSRLGSISVTSVNEKLSTVSKVKCLGLKSGGFSKEGLDTAAVTGIYRCVADQIISWKLIAAYLGTTCICLVIKIMSREAR